MGLISGFKERFDSMFSSLFSDSEEESKRIGIYGPPNAGKSTLANKISNDWSGEEMGAESEVAHETRKVERKSVEIERDGKTVGIDIVDTPGVSTRVDYKEFLDDMNEEDAKRRAREATEGVSEAMYWLREDIDGVLYVLDATEDPFTQVNTMLTGIIESQDMPIIVLANKMDHEDADLKRIKQAFPQHDNLPISALEGDNTEQLYDKIAEKFG